MQVHALTPYVSALGGLLRGTFPVLETSDISAHLLGPSYIANAETDTVLADIKTYEIKCADYQPVRVQGKQFEPSATESARWIFTSDPLSFGGPITLPIFRFLVLATGLPNQSAANKKLLAFADLAPSGAREVVRGELQFSAGEDGWLSLSSGQST